MSSIHAWIVKWSKFADQYYSLRMLVHSYFLIPVLQVASIFSICSETIIHPSYFPNALHSQGEGALLGPSRARSELNQGFTSIVMNT